MTNYVSSQVIRDNKTESFPNATNPAFVEGFYVDFARSVVGPVGLASVFREIFKEEEVMAKPRIGPSFRPASLFNATARASVDGAARVGEAEAATLQDRRRANP